MKKLITSLSICAMLATMLPVSSFAAIYALCSVQDCSHTNNGDECLLQSSGNKHAHHNSGKSGGHHLMDERRNLK
ncbi:hypothetical protein [Lacrimispora sp.]|uniref:hypothetical protein n=1 Tax=Lacrimispora sp. TaxID=2719234 RepID=UPI0029DEB26A|nr:hypothetical protein [Lacrimispora sp.]